jgi:hypothetical protein
LTSMKNICSNYSTRSGLAFLRISFAPSGAEGHKQETPSEFLKNKSPEFISPDF